MPRHPRTMRLTSGCGTGPVLCTRRNSQNRVSDSAGEASTALLA